MELLNTGGLRPQVGSVGMKQKQDPVVPLQDWYRLRDKTSRFRQPWVFLKTEQDVQAFCWYKATLI